MLAVARDWNFFRERGKPTARSYVQDGLVAMWDGIENAGWGVHDPNATVWTNLIDAAANFNLASSGVSWGNDHLIMANGETDNPNVATVDKQYPIMRNATIEIVVRLSSRWTYFSSAAANYKQAQTLLRMGVSGTSSASRGFAVKTGGGQGDDALYSTLSSGRPSDNYYSRYYIDFANYFNKKCAISVCPVSTDGVANINGIQHGYITTYMNASYGTTTLIGAISGEMYCIRLYSRALTADEIAANYAVDKERFNLP